MNLSSTGDHLSPLDLSLRADKVRSEISDQEALVTMGPSDVQWLTGFTGSNGIVYLDHEKFILLTDKRYEEQGPQQIKESFSSAEVMISKTPMEDIPSLALNKIIKVDPNLITWKAALQLEEIIEGGITPSTPLKALRAQKDQCEIDRIALAARIVDEALNETIPFLSGNPSEMEIATHLDFKIREKGASGNAYQTIVASGVNSSKPHAQPSAKKIENGDLVIIDVGAVVDGYRSDMTRTFIIGEPSVLQQKYMTVVRESQEEAIKILKPGTACAELDRQCRKKIEEAGWGDLFIHGTGHGVGLDIHEAPAINSKSSENLLTGMVVTIEPGIYFSDNCGVRWEDLYEITESGARQLTLSAKSPQV